MRAYKDSNYQTSKAILIYLSTPNGLLLSQTIMSNHKTQIAIVGGGICGLWLLNILRAAGYDTWLFEKDTLGCAQSLASQGMIHGGLKYALGGFTSPSSESIARMPETWQACLRGEGPPDLTGLNTLSDDYYLF